MAEELAACDVKHFKILNLSIVGIVIALIIAIIQIVIYRKDSDGQCRSRKLNLGFGITSIVLCTIWLILMIVLLVKSRQEGSLCNYTGFSVL